MTPDQVPDDAAERFIKSMWSVDPPWDLDQPHPAWLLQSARAAIAAAHNALHREPSEHEFLYAPGDKVQRRGQGYRFPGVVIGRGTKLDGKRRLYMVECEIEGVRGCVHVFGEGDLEPQEGRVDE